ncbi:hypothetical protein ACWGID_32145 [Kribbella sp. NPDC054772]
MADRFDLDAIEADDALLDLLAAGGESARAAGEHDPAVALLADLRLAVEVEDELPVETIDDPESFLARCAALNPITDPFARKVATRGLALGVAAVAALSVSGVAAAVTGDPLSPYEKVIEKMVDAVRPQTSFPKEELDGLPVLDKTKIVKVAKDFQDKTKAEHAAQTNGKDDSSLVDGDLSSINMPKPPLVKPIERPVAILDKPLIVPNEPAKTQDPGKPIGSSKSDDDKTNTPTDTTTGGKGTTDTPTTPTTPPDTPTTPTPTPTGDPTEPGSSTTPTPTDSTTTTPTSPPANVDTGTGDNSAAADPTATPSSDSGTGQTDTSSGVGTTAPDAGAGSGTAAPDSGTGSTGGTDGTGATSGTDTSGAGSTATPSSDVTQAPSDLADAVNDLLGQTILPTPTGAPLAVESAERFFGGADTPAAVGSTPVAPKPVAPKPAATKPAATKATAKHATAKHSSGKVTTGSVRKTYKTGKHSTGAYPEGKHAAIDRTHGSTEEANLLKILGIVNTPTK